MRMATAVEPIEQVKSRIEEVDPASARREIDENGALLIDVREPDEYRQGHLPGAVNIPRGLLEFQLSGQGALSDRNLRVVLYCKTSGRAALAARTMQDMGYLQVQSVAGGFDLWAASGKAVVVPPLPSFG